MASDDPNRQDAASPDSGMPAVTPAPEKPAEKVTPTKGHARKGAARAHAAATDTAATTNDAGASPAEIEAAVARLTPPGEETLPSETRTADASAAPPNPPDVTAADAAKADEEVAATEAVAPPRPAEPTPPAYVPARREGPSPWLALPVGAIAGALAAGAVAYALVETGTLQPSRSSDLQPLLTRVAALEQRPQQDLAPSVAQLDSRVAQLEGAKGAVEALGQELGGVKQSLTALNTSTTQAATLAQQAAGLAGQVAALTKKVDDLSASSVALDRGLAAVVALGALRDAVLAGRPFAAELDAARRALGGNSAALDPLAPAAAQGYPAPGRLAEKLQEAARAPASQPLAASPAAPKEGGLMDRLLSSAEGLVRVGSTDAGPAPADQTLIDAAVAALRSGDAAQALAKLDALSPDAKAKVKPVVAEITARRDAAATLATLNQQALAAISGKLP